MKKELACIRCGHKWIPFVRKPKQCPKCRSTRWNIPYTRAPRSRWAKEHRASYG